nr:anion permease [Hyphomonadaceae bacterium]
MADARDTGTFEEEPAGGALVRRIGLLAGLGVFALMLASPPPASLEPLAWKALALLALMIIWWITEAIPVAATALLPLVGLPVMGVAKPAD